MSEKRIIIGVTDCSKYKNYNDWISKPGNIETIQLSATRKNLADLALCDGVVLTGGEDVHPRFYNRPDLLPYCYADDISEIRDEFELQVLQYTEARGIPVLGICRGLQIANVFFGGTLIPDLPQWGKFNHSKLPDNTDRYHTIQPDPNAQLYQITEGEEGMINSNHHQCADRVGQRLVASALSPDGIVEAMERRNPDEGAFLCLVQWHPERMKDQGSNFAKKIRGAFIAACQQKKQEAAAPKP
ncbi:MAG: gamma-glutamyl-gamma-aminobutyrate hydrolase family protein [Chitinophagaceae bacterium]|nr:gamma-glutamyl-gamma-aminobutyrate hydrolase family protein [Chitinophagaceae bacterium]